MELPRQRHLGHPPSNTVLSASSYVGEWSILVAMAIKICMVEAVEAVLSDHGRLQGTTKCNARLRAFKDMPRTDGAITKLHYN